MGREARMNPNGQQHDGIGTAPLQQLTVTLTPHGVTVAGITDKLLAIAMLETAKHTILASAIGSTQPTSVIVPAKLVLR